MWKLVHQFGLIDARRLYSIIRARLETISRLKEALESGAKEVPDIHNVIARDTWLLDPRWDLLDHEVKVELWGSITPRNRTRPASRSTSCSYSSRDPLPPWTKWW